MWSRRAASCSPKPYGTPCSGSESATRMNVQQLPPSPRPIAGRARLTCLGGGGKVEAVSRPALPDTQEPIPTPVFRWPTDCRQNAEVGTCRESAGVTQRPSGRSVPFCTAWAAASDFTSPGFQGDLMSSFRNIAQSSLCMVASGTGMQPAGLRIRQKATSISGQRNSAKTWTVTAGWLRLSRNWAGASLPSGSVRFKRPHGSVPGCRGFFVVPVRQRRADAGSRRREFENAEAADLIEGTFANGIFLSRGHITLYMMRYTISYSTRSVPVPGEMVPEPAALTAIDIPALVREIRKSRQMTQEQLARELEVTFSTVNGWENGKHRPIPVLARKLVELAEAADIPPARYRAGTARAGRQTRRRR